jgi:hypothetical protein
VDIDGIEISDMAIPERIKLAKMLLETCQGADDVLSKKKQQEIHNATLFLDRALEGFL